MKDERSVALALDILEWRETKLKLDALEASIAEQVIELGKTQTVGDVRATFSAGRRTYDYKAAALAANVRAELVAKHTKTIPASESTDWRAICEEASVDGILVAQSEPSVKLKFIG